MGDEIKKQAISWAENCTHGPKPCIRRGINSGFELVFLRNCNFCGAQAAIEAEIIVDHASSGEAFSGAIIGASAVETRELAISVKLDEHFTEAVSVVAFEIQGSVAPHFAIDLGVIGYDGAARECGFNRGKASRFVARSCGKNCRLAVERTQLRFG